LNLVILLHTLKARRGARASALRDYNCAFLRSVGAQAQAEGAKASKNFEFILNCRYFTAKNDKNIIRKFENQELHDIIVLQKTLKIIRKKLQDMTTFCNFAP
jgi:hypothetical protein